MATTTDCSSSSGGGGGGAFFSGGTRAAGLLLVLLTSSPLAQVGAQWQFVAPADAGCDMAKWQAIPQMFTEINAACPGYATGQCSLACELAMAPAMLGDCKATFSAIVDQSEGVPDGLAETTDRVWQTCLRSNAPADVAAAVSAVAGCGAAPPSPPAGGGHRRLQDAIDAAIAMLTALVTGDGSVCAMATALEISQTLPCEDNPAWVDAQYGRACSYMAAHQDQCDQYANAVGITAASACPVSCESGCALTYDDCCELLPAMTSPIPGLLLTGL